MFEKKIAGWKKLCFRYKLELSTLLKAKGFADRMTHHEISKLSPDELLQMVGYDEISEEVGTSITADNSLITEEISSSGTSPYGKAKSKLCSELLSIFEDSYTRFIWARVFSVYGPSDKSDSILMELYKSELEGDELNVDNPKTLWSFLYEDDFADAVKRILESTNVSGVVNIANPQLVEIQRIVDTWLGSSHNSSEGYENDKVEEGFFPMVGKLKSIGWAPEVSLEEGIQRTRKAYREHFNSN
jgi:nucleoside-diphosphate-sugar epimerase